MSEATWVVVGVIGRAHGVRGDVSVDLRTDEPQERFQPGVTMRSQEDGTELTVTSARRHGDRFLVHFDQIPDRTAAEMVRGMVLQAEVDPDEQPDDPDEFYDRHLVGLEVRVAGQAVGTVTGVTHAAQDLLTIDVDGTERLVPFVTALVPRIEVREGWLEVVDLPGLLDDQDLDAPQAK